MNKTLLIILLLIFSSSSLPQDKKSLKNIKKLNLQVDILYRGGEKNSFPTIYVSEEDLKENFTLELRKSRIQVNDSKKLPLLVVRIILDKNAQNFSSGNDGWIMVSGEIFLTQNVVVSSNKTNIKAITWVGEKMGANVKLKDSSIINNSLFSSLLDFFLLQYLEVNPL